jgi:predicted GNAT family N-acyltransferase
MGEGEAPLRVSAGGPTGILKCDLRTLGEVSKIAVCVRDKEPGMTPQTVAVTVGDWARLREDACAVRHAVFVVEQNVPPEIELDEFDPVSVHAVAYDGDGRVLGTGRLLPDGHIGRMAVHRHARGRGVGARLLQALVDAGEAAGHARLVLNAQVHARGFYEAHGFVVEGEPFIEAGIPHVTMSRRSPAGQGA